MEEWTHGGNGVHEFAGFSFDIFQVEAEGVVWRGAAASFAEANKRVREFASTLPTDYIIWNRNTGDKQTVKSGDQHEGAAIKEAHS